MILQIQLRAPISHKKIFSKEFMSTDQSRHWFCFCVWGWPSSTFFYSTVLSGMNILGLTWRELWLTSLLCQSAGAALCLKLCCKVWPWSGIQQGPFQAPFASSEQFSCTRIQWIYFYLLIWICWQDTFSYFS